jgi:hypothetical protein
MLLECHSRFGTREASNASRKHNCWPGLVPTRGWTLGCNTIIVHDTPDLQAEQDLFPHNLTVGRDTTFCRSARVSGAHFCLTLYQPDIPSLYILVPDKYNPDSWFLLAPHLHHKASRSPPICGCRSRPYKRRRRVQVTVLGDDGAGAESSKPRFPWHDSVIGPPASIANGLIDSPRLDRRRQIISVAGSDRGLGGCGPGKTAVRTIGLVGVSG